MLQYTLASLLRCSHITCAGRTNVWQPTVTLIKCSLLCKFSKGLILAHENALLFFPFSVYCAYSRGVAQSFPAAIRRKCTQDMSPNETTNTPASHTRRGKLESPNHPVCVIVVCRRKMKCPEKSHTGTGMGEHANEANNHHTAALPLVRMECIEKHVKAFASQASQFKYIPRNKKLWEHIKVVPAAGIYYIFNLLIDKFSKKDLSLPQDNKNAFTHQLLPYHQLWKQIKQSFVCTQHRPGHKSIHLFIASLLDSPTLLLWNSCLHCVTKSRIVFNLPQRRQRSRYGT